MNLAIVGSRNFNNYKKLENCIFETLEKWGKEISDIECIISGGAKGVDALAEKFAKTYDILVEIYAANWDKYGKAAGVIRNSSIINNATHVIAFPSISGKGTQDSIKKAKTRKIQCEVIYIESLKLF